MLGDKNLKYAICVINCRNLKLVVTPRYPLVKYQTRYEQLPHTP